MSTPIEVHDVTGRRSWAWETDTDPDGVLWAVVLAYAKGAESLCAWDCPAVDGRYCLDCHATAYAAVEELRRRGYS
jgi:hypothetical protein